MQAARNCAANGLSPGAGLATADEQAEVRLELSTCLKGGKLEMSTIIHPQMVTNILLRIRFIRLRMRI